MNTVLEDQDVKYEYETELRFRPGGPAILGVQAKAETADVKFTEWLGLYGQASAVLTFTATSNGETSPVKNRTYEGGPQVT
ncbi:MULTISPECIES: hypothetical protein [unclassified Streptomyces]|uniref:hypothetical protein n=1 Tax=unclassified Streptomyces TaxID=2593676 RepID=UPI003801206E